MGLLIHLGLTATLLTTADLIGVDITPKIAITTIIGGVFLDSDKILEMYQNRRKPNKVPDITAKCRVFHSILAWPFGLILSFLSFSCLPFFAVIIHILLDSLPILIQDHKSYPLHSPWKWLANPFSKKSWVKVSYKWPITYPVKINLTYNKLGQIIGIGLLLASIFYWLIKI